MLEVELRALFGFPDPVNETSARLVALGVVVQATLFLVIREGWLLAPLVYGFLARVSTGPTLSPLGQLVTRWVTPWVERRFDVRSRFVPGPPKRFAQGIGLTFSAAAATAWALGATTVGWVLVGVLLVAASLEAFLAICLGCIAYQALWGCADCNDLSERLRRAIEMSRRPEAVGERSSSLVPDRR